MATDIRSSVSSERSTVIADHDVAIRRKIDQTRRRVKLAELATGLLIFSASSVLFLLLLAVVDHWIIGLGFTARLMALLTFVAGGGWFIYRYVLPLLFHSINPMYAARVIEEGQPELKNSLMNFMFLSREEKQVHKAVLQAVRTQAETGLANIPIDHIVDYSKAIRLGYVLAFLTIVFVFYKVVSPKDPIQTAMRVIAPWADVARPSRVTIEEVHPGDADLYQGQTLEVTVKAYNLGSDDQVTLHFTTEDRQIVQRAVVLEPGTDSYYYQGEVTTGNHGIQQNLTYRITAGDAETRVYRVRALEAPAIDVASVEYRYPAYTGDEPRTQTADGHIRALENTLVTIKARANHPIEKAHLEFDPMDKEGQSYHQSLPMKIDSEDASLAQVTFPLVLNTAGNRGKYRNYQVRFRTPDDALNPHPVLYDIDVIRDLPPEIGITSPAEERVEVPLDRSLPVTFRAIDPDYSVRRIIARGSHNGETIFSRTLLDEPRSGQVIQRWELVPRDLELKVGQTIQLVGEAQDDKTDHRGQRTPNITTSEVLEVRIVEPIGSPEDAPPQDGDQGRDGQPDQQDQPGDDQSQGERAPQDQRPQDGQPDDQRPQDDQDQGEPQDPDQPMQEGEEGQEGGPQDQRPQDPQQEQGGQEGDEGQPGDMDKAGDQGPGEPQEGPQEGQEGAGGDEGQQQDAEGRGGREAGDPQNEGQDPGEQQGGEPGEPTGKPGKGDQDGEPQPGDAQPNENSQVERRDEPVNADGSQDGDAFERIQDFLKEQQNKQQPKSEDRNNQEAAGDEMGQSGGGDQSAGDAQQEADGGPRPEVEPDAQDQRQPQAEGDPAANDAQRLPENRPDGPEGEGDGSRGDEDEGAEESEMGDQAERQNDQKVSDGEVRDVQGDEAGGSGSEGGMPQDDDPSQHAPEQPEGDVGGSGDNTDSGAGQPADEGNESGSPSSNPEYPNRPKDLNGEQSAPDPMGAEEEAQSPSSSDSTSDSEGDAGGEESGGGKQGGGQGAEQAGKDSAGSTSAGDEGAGAAEQEGEGELSEKGGEGPESDSKTGMAGQEERGDGSEDAAAPGSGDPVGEGQPAEQADETSQEASDSGQGGTGQPTGGGVEGPQGPVDPNLPNDEPGAEEANLEYSRQATEMILDQLKHQQDQPDKELLDRLGWTPEQLRQFMNRWESMRDAAQSDQAPEAKRELDDALRSLGLSRGEDRVREVEATQRASGGAGETQRSQPPASFLEQYRAYLKGGSR